MTFVVAQLGARMHYAVPSILARANLLERLYTDTYAPRALRSVLTMTPGMGPASLRRWLGRIPADIPEHKIISFDRMGLEYYWRQKRAASSDSQVAPHLWAGKKLCRRVIHRGIGNASGLYTFNSAGLELLQYARAQGVFTVMEQTIAPRVVEERLLTREAEDHPGWAPARRADPALPAFIEREQMEWEAADLILCGSEFVRNGIQASGGPSEHCCVVPYGIASPSIQAKKSRGLDQRRLRVLTVGAVGLRKGAPYVLAAARALASKAEFRMVGTLDITAHAQSLLNSHLSLLGPVPRSEIQQQFRWADVFLLPSICEGSARVCYEALAWGLPVITTPNAGSVVREGTEGFIVPIRDSKAIIERIERLADDSDLLAAMSRNALERSTEYTLDRYGARLLNALALASGVEAKRSRL